MMTFLRTATFLVVALTGALAQAQSFVVVTEFYNSALKQYFRTANSAEAAGIDAGAAGAGWSRTGDNFVAWANASAAGTFEVCRFYGSMSPGPNSHFYTASSGECAHLRALQASVPATQPRWNYEGIAFAIQLPASGVCAAGTQPVYRSYNNGFTRGIDSNHRYTTSSAEYDRINATGWFGEGVVMCACNSQTNNACAGLLPAVTPPATSSWKRLLDEVITPKCASCHTAGNAYATQSGLVLDAAVAYKNLVNAEPKNVVALAHAFKRVKPRVADDSLFYEKLLLWDPTRLQHFGAPMPLGGASLSVGQLEFVKRWINEGASETTDSISPDLLKDNTLPAYAPFAALPPPERGIQLTTGAFSVSPNFERELFIYRKLNNPTPIYVNKFETRMRNNSHHLILYGLDGSVPSFAVPAPDVIRDLRNANNSLNLTAALTMPYHLFVAGAMTPSGSYTFPPGVALELPANSGIDLNSHYVNKTTTPLTGEAYANLHTVDRSAVQKVAYALFLNNTSFSLPPGQRTVISKSHVFDQPRHVLMLTSHTHQLGEKFVIKIKGGARDGEIVFTNTDWSHPNVVTFDPPLALQAGQGLTSEITYNNTTTRTISFGFLSDDEMGIIYGYYYSP